MIVIVRRSGLGSGISKTPDLKLVSSSNFVFNSFYVYELLLLDFLFSARHTIDWYLSSSEHMYEFLMKGYILDSVFNSYFGV